jgi:hypothetical protein
MLVVASAGMAQARQLEIETLKGIDKLKVLVESLPEVVEDAGVLRSADIKTNVELKLRLAGIKVVSDDADVVPVLHVWLIIFSGRSIEGDPLYFGVLQVALAQPVRLDRDPKICTFAKTWEETRLQTHPRGSLQRFRDDPIGGAMDKFINDYLSVNPKK